MWMSKAVCVACRHKIDAAAKLCPYCGANPVTGERIDTQAILQEVFRPRSVSAAESVLEYARQRQGLVIALSIFLLLVILAALHQFVTSRNDSATTADPAVPLTEITDLSNEPREQPKAMPELQFQYDGRPQSMRMFIVEPGATPPPDAQPQPAQPGQAAAQPAPAPPQQPQAAPPHR
jgi:hypothetical protein